MSIELSPFRLGLMITEKCNIECRHCWFESGPQKEATMTPEEISKYINEAHRIRSIKYISLTGGEPMLFPELVEKSIELATSYRLKTELVTNCYWAETEFKAIKWLRTLRELGLDTVNISSDDFHQEFISFKHVRNCYNASKQLGINIVVMTTIKKTSNILLKEISRLLGDDLLDPNDKFSIGCQAIGVESGFIPVGRGSLINSEEWVEGGPLEGQCSLVLRDIGVRPGGEVMPCCSALSSLRFMRIGNLNNESLSKIVNRAQEIDVYKILRRHGPSGFNIPLLGFGKFVNKCHFCYEALRKLEINSISKETNLTQI